MPRLQPPVQSSGTVVTELEGRVCPFRGGDITLPKNACVTACLYLALVDESHWGEKALHFQPGAHPRSSYLNWNGPFDGDAPRKCPGMEVSYQVGLAMLAAYVRKERAAQRAESGGAADVEA